MWETPPSTARHDRIRRLSFVTQTITRRTSRKRSSNLKKRLNSQETLKLNFKCGPYQEAGSIHQRHSLCVRRAPWAPGAPVLHPRAALPPPHYIQTPRMEKGGRGHENSRMWRRSCGNCGKVVTGQAASRAPASPQPPDTLCRVRHPSSGAPRRGRAVSS